MSNHLSHSRESPAPAREAAGYSRLIDPTSAPRRPAPLPCAPTAAPATARDRRAPGRLHGRTRPGHLPGAYEAKVLGRIVPFHGADHLDRTAEVDRTTRSRRRTPATRELRPALLGLLRGAVIDRDDLVDLTPLLPGADANPQRSSRSDGLTAGRLQRIHVQEHIARAVGQRSEAEALLRVEPFHRRLHLGRGRSGSERWKRHRSGGVAVEIVVIEAAPAGPDPDEAQIREAISGQTCRCTGYENIVRSIRWAAEHSEETP